ncbi:MAG: hypothetical protein M0027_19430 [Candidatus Dormibacteraeota bacterium]|jgi:hypothetical protein|nr:hypothetical protein [Candidatus Dormibacteraeota bacterium]
MKEPTVAGVAEPLDPESLMRMDLATLEQLRASFEDEQRALRLELAPLQARMGDLNRRQEVILTELRRRERQQQLVRRRRVRTEVQEGQAPSILDLVEAQAPPAFGEPPFSALEFLLATGGVVALGYPGSRVPTLQMTDGSRVSTVADLAEARQLYQLGWEFGVPARKGIRVHTPGTRLERLLEPKDCFVRPKEAALPPPSRAATGDG